MNTVLYQGELVRLKGRDPEQFAAAMSRWNRDTEFQRLLDSSVLRVVSKKILQEWIDKDFDNHPERDFLFLIHTLQDDRLIGFIGLDGISWSHGDCWVFIGLGERDTWGKGYGSEAMRLVLCYAFHELNLQRVSLDVFSYNPRAIRSYEKCGFVVEGRARGMLNREGQRHDLVFMGILKEEWERTASAGGSQDK